MPLRYVNFPHNFHSKLSLVECALNGVIVCSLTRFFDPTAHCKKMIAGMPLDRCPWLRSDTKQKIYSKLPRPLTSRKQKAGTIQHQHDTISSSKTDLA